MGVSKDPAQAAQYAATFTANCCYYFQLIARKLTDLVRASSIRHRAFGAGRKAEDCHVPN